MTSIDILDQDLFISSSEDEINSDAAACSTRTGTKRIKKTKCLNIKKQRCGQDTIYGVDGGEEYMSCSSSVLSSSSSCYDDSPSDDEYSSDEEDLRKKTSKKEGEEKQDTDDDDHSKDVEFDPDKVHIMSYLKKDGGNQNMIHEESLSKGDDDVPERVIEIFSSLLKKQSFQFSQPVSFLRMIRVQVNQAMNSAFSSMLSNSGIRYLEDCVGVVSNEGEPKNVSGDSHQNKTNDSENSIDNRERRMRRVAKILSDIAANCNPENHFRPAVALLKSAGSAATNKKLYNNNENEMIPQIWNKVIFYREIHSVISLYLSLVYVQRAMNNDNTNSSGYAEGMVTKILNIIGKIPYNEMSREKYISVGRDALYLYQNVITDMTGPKHYKRLRTPQQQADFCYVIAMLVNDVPITSDSRLSGKATNLVQFASATVDPAYHLAVHKMACVFNSSYSVYKILTLDRRTLIRANKILTILSARNKYLSERKPRTVTQSVFLYLQPWLRDRLRASGLTSEESSLGTAVKLVSQQLLYDGITRQTIEDGCSIMSGSYEAEDGVTLKYLGAGVKDIKTVGLSALFTDRLRKRMRQNLPYY